MKVCRIEMLGGLNVRVGEQSIPRFRSHKAGALLSYLALNLRRHHARELLLDLFWPEMTPKTARDNLSTALSLLRRQLEAAGAPASQILLTDYQNVRLNPETVTTDVDEFEQLLKTASRIDSPAERAAQLERAVGLYRGDLLPGCYEEWAVQEQVRLKTHYADSLQRWTAALAQAGDLEGALSAAQQARQADPYREATWQAQIWLQAVLGRPRLALETYRELEQRFGSELNIAPSAATRTLMERLRRDPDRFTAQNRSMWSAEPSAHLLTGEDRHSDVEQSQHAVVVVRLPQPQSPPSPQTSSLPPQFTPFFGREEELARLREMLTPGNGVGGHRPRIVTVTGPGGVGKTRLVVELASQIEAAYGGSVWFVPLADVPDPALLPFALAKALKLSSARSSDPMEEIVQRLREQDCLLILDNFEHLLRDPQPVSKGDHPMASGAAASIYLLLKRIPGLRYLVTSRQLLHLTGEQEFPIGPLTVPIAENQTPEQLLTCSSVALYENRARAVKPDFAVTTRNAEAVAALCRKLEGMPLAIEMTAAWAKTLPLPRLLERLEHQLDVLVSRRRDLPLRHQSLRATIEWSYGLLAPELQTAFLSLSVFRNGWTLEAAEAILEPGLSVSPRSSSPVSPPSALETLARLQERSLIVAEEQGDDVRYRLLSSLHEFAMETLTANGMSATIQARHAAYFLAFVETTSPKFDGPERPAAFRCFVAENENIVAALEWHAGRDADAESLERACRIAAAMIFFWIARGYWQERRIWLEGLATRSTFRTEARARVLIGAGILARDEENYERAQARFEEALEIMQEVDCQQGIALTLMEMGIVAAGRKDYAAAQTLYKQSLTRLDALKDRRNIATVYYYFGELLYKQGNLPAARHVWERCYAVEQELKVIGGGALWVLGRLLTEMGDYAEARRVLRKHLLDRCETGSISGTMSSLEEHALLAAAQGHWQRAGKLWGAATMLRRLLGSRVADSPAEIKEYQERTERLRAEAGAETFDAAFTAGCAFSREQAVAYALEDVPE